MKIKLLLTRDENIKHYNASEVMIDIEEYVRGVVASEIGNAALEACKAQAVAARTFALIKHSKGSRITDKSSSDQAFRASRLSNSYANVLLATKETAGQVLYYNGKLVTTCSYSNSNGGRIKSSKEVWGGERAWLISKEDPYDHGPGNGHGVGMSQYGAKEMARLGFNYKQILQFYYPNTDLKNDYGSIPQEPEVIKVAYQAKITAPSGKTVNMRQSASTSAPVIVPIAIGEIVDVVSVTGEWSQITWCNKSGYMMSKYLAKVDGTEKNKIWYVKIECDSEEQAKAFAQILKKAKAAT
jgi:hypothetical protein